MQIFDEQNRREVYNTWINAKRYCNLKICYNSGGGIIIVETPIEYKGIDCFLCLDDDDCLAIYINRVIDDEAPFYDEYALIYFDQDEHLPDWIIEDAKKLMKEKFDYYESFGINYMAYARVDMVGVRDMLP